MKLKSNLFQRVSRFAIVPTFAVVLSGSATQYLHAATWDGSESTDWNTAGNWDSNSVPNGQNAVINTNTGNVATISVNPSATANDVIVGDGGGSNGLVNHTGGLLSMVFWFKVGHNGGAGVYNLGVTGGSGTYTGLSQGSGSITVGTGGQLRLGGDGSGGGNGTLNINTSGNVTVTSDIAVGKNGSGTLNFDGGTINKTAGTFIIGEGSGVTGLMRMSGGTVNNTGEFWVGNNAGGNGTLTLSGGSINQDSWFSIGRNGATGVVNLSDGTITKTATNSHFVVGDGTFANSTGTLNQTGGSIDLRSQLYIGKGNGAGSLATGTATISGGTVQVDSWLAVGRDGASGTLTISGTGSVTQGSDGDPFSNLELTNGTTGSATVNLGNGGSGGTLTAMGIVKSGDAGSTSTINFNGGTLRAGRNNSTFMQGLTTTRVRDGGGVIDTQGFDVTIAQNIVRSASFGDAGTGVLSKTGSGTLTLSGAGDNAGLRARVEVGTLVLAKNSSSAVHAVGTDGGADYALEITGGTARLGGTNGDQIYVNSAVNMTGGTFDLAGLSEGFDGLSGNGGTLTNSAASTTSTLTLGQNNSGGSPVFSGLIENGVGTVALVKTGTGTQTLGGANTYSGGTNLSGGTLIVSNDAALGTGALNMATGTTLRNSDVVSLTLANNIVFDSSATLWAGGDLNLNGALSGGSSGLQIAVKGPGTVTVNNQGHNLGSGATPAVWTVTDGGTLAMTQGNNLGNLPASATTQVILDNGTFETITANGQFFSSRGLQVNAAGGTWTDSAGGISLDGPVANQGVFTINTSISDASSTINGAVSGTGSLIKTGDGTLVLSSDSSSYSGATSVTSGKLLVNGNISTSVTTTVSGAGILGGSGTVGSLIVQLGGTLSPGNSPGILNTGTLDLQSGSTLGIEINGIDAGSTYDQLNVTGSATLAGLLNISLGFTPANNDLFFILLNDSDDAVNGTFNGLADNSEFSVGEQVFKISYFGDSGTSSFTGGNDVVLMTIPEPRAALLGALGLLVLIRRQRR
ncbi:MAG: beta strand repeat-containing protein [Luteolibacter sp.]